MKILKWLVTLLLALIVLLVAWRVYVDRQVPDLITRFGASVEFAAIQRSKTPYDYLRAEQGDTPLASPDGPPLQLPQAPPIVKRTIETLFGDRIVSRHGEEYVLLDREGVLGFPDFITISVRDDGKGGTRVLAYATSIYAQVDLRERVEAWFDVLEAAR